MNELINILISEYFGLTSIMIIILVCVLVSGVWWAAKVYNTARTFPCVHHTSSILNHDGRINSLENKLSSIEGQNSVIISMLSQLIPSIQTSRPNISVDQKKSPRQLNDNGVYLFREFNGSAFIENNADFLIKALEALKPKSALDVENYALSVLVANVNDDRFTPLKNWVYMAPAQPLRSDNGETEEVVVDLNTVLSIISLKLRDLYLERHPELIP